MADDRPEIGLRAAWERGQVQAIDPSDISRGADSLGLSEDQFQEFRRRLPTGLDKVPPDEARRITTETYWQIVAGVGTDTPIRCVYLPGGQILRYNGKEDGPAFDVDGDPYSGVILFTANGRVFMVKGVGT